MFSFAFAKFRKVLFIVCVLLVASCIVTKANAATEAELKVKESENFPIIEGQTQVNFTFFLQEKSNEFGTIVNILPSDLRDSKRGLTIPGDAITVSENNTNAREKFELIKGDTKIIAVSVNTEDVKAGSYQGIIIVNADNATDVELSLTIQVSKPFLDAALWNLVGIIFGVVGTIFGVVIKTQKDRRLKDIKETIQKYGWTIGGAIILLIALYLSSLLALYPTMADFGADGWIDNITAIFFGLGQYGGSSAAASVIKAVQDVRARARTEQEK